jgi:hypothetical protein
VEVCVCEREIERESERVFFLNELKESCVLPNLQMSKALSFNAEWNFAWELKFGIYEWNPSMGMERRLRKGAEVSHNSVLPIPRFEVA